MNVIIIHKGSKNSSSVRNYLDRNDEYSFEEISLYDGTLSGLKDIIPDIVIFDSIIWKGDLSDVGLIKEIRKILPRVPILLASSNSESSKYHEEMLNEGVDGCVQVPFLAEELHLRIMKLVSKKNTLLFNGTSIGTEDVTMDIRNHVVAQHGEKVSLTKTEYSILLHLFLHKNVLVSTKELSSCLKEAGEDSLALGTHIFNLRKKINSPELITTVPLYGFTVSDKLKVLDSSHVR
jgi:two-component system KDP operon response regulator KdpE